MTYQHVEYVLGVYGGRVRCARCGRRLKSGHGCVLASSICCFIVGPDCVVDKCVSDDWWIVKRSRDEQRKNARNAWWDAVLLESAEDGYKRIAPKQTEPDQVCPWDVAACMILRSRGLDPEMPGWRGLRDITAAELRSEKKK